MHACIHLHHGVVAFLVHNLKILQKEIIGLDFGLKGAIQPKPINLIILFYLLSKIVPTCYNLNEFLKKYFCQIFGNI